MFEQNNHNKDPLEQMGSLRWLCQIALSFCDHTIHDCLIFPKPYQAINNDFMKVLGDLREQLILFFTKGPIVDYLNRKRFTYTLVTRMEEAQFEKLMRSKLQNVEINLIIKNFKLLLQEPNSRLYKGEIQNSKRWGLGLETAADTSLYIGEFSNDERSGAGILRTVDGVHYEGSFKGNKKDGFGELFTGGGERYIGHFVNNQYQGQGTQIVESAFTYTGKFEAGVRQGIGRMRLADGTKVEGNFFKGEPQGQVNVQYPSGDTYKGGLLFWKREGHGVYEKLKSYKFTGMFKDDLEHGPGTMNTADGYIYIGFFNRGLKIGEFVVIHHNSGKHKFVKYDVDGEQFRKLEPGEGAFREDIFDPYMRCYRMETALSNIYNRNLEVIFRIYEPQTYLDSNSFTAYDIKEETKLQIVVSKKPKTNDIIPLDKESLVIRRKSSVGKPIWIISRKSQRIKTLARQQILLLSEKSVTSFSKDEIHDAFREGSISKLRSIYREIRKGRMNGMSIFKMLDSKKRNVLHLAGYAGQHQVLLDTCCLLFLLLKDKKTNSKTIESLLRAKDINGSTVIDLIAEKGTFAGCETGSLDGSFGDVLSAKLQAIEDEVLSFEKETEQFSLFNLSVKELHSMQQQYLNQLEKAELKKEYVTLIEDGELEIARDKMSLSVISKRGVSIEIILAFSKHLGIQNLITKEDYFNKHNCPLHWAIYWGDIYTVLILLEFDYQMIFWKNSEDEAPPEIIFKTNFRERKSQASAIIASVMDELYRVLYYKFVKEKYFLIDPKEDILADNMDDKFLIANTRLVPSSFIFESPIICQSLLTKFYSKCSEKTEAGFGGYQTLLQKNLIKHFSGVSDKKTEFIEKYLHMIEYLFGFTVLLNSSEHYDIRLIKVLGIDPFKIFADGNCIFHILTIKDEASSIEFIIRHLIREISLKMLKTKELKIKMYDELMKKLNTQEKSTLNTPMHLAIIHKSISVLQVLLRYDIELNSPNLRGWTARELLGNIRPFTIDHSTLVIPDHIKRHAKRYLISGQKYLLKCRSLMVTWKSLTNLENQKIFFKIVKGKLNDPAVMTSTFDPSSVFYGADLGQIQREYTSYFTEVKHTFKESTDYLKEDLCFENITLPDLETQLIEFITVIESSPPEDFDIVSRRLLRPLFRNFDALKFQHVIDGEALIDCSDIYSIYCIEVTDNSLSYQRTKIYEKLMKLRALYQDFGGGIKVDIITAENQSFNSLINCFVKITACFMSRSNWHRKLQSRYSNKNLFYFLVSISDDLLYQKAKELNLKTFNMRHQYSSSFKECIHSRYDLEPLREFEKQRILLMLFSDVFSFSVFKRKGFIKDSYFLHDKKRLNMIIKHGKKTIRELRLRDYILGENSKQSLSSLIVIAEYFGLQHGAYMSFVFIFTKWSIVLFIVVSIKDILKFYPEVALKYETHINLFLNFTIGLWSSAIVNKLQRSTTETMYATGRNKTEELPEDEEVQIDFKGDKVISERDFSQTRTCQQIGRLKKQLLLLTFYLPVIIYVYLSYMLISKLLNYVDGRDEIIDANNSYYAIGVLNYLMNSLAFHLFVKYNKFLIKFYNYRTVKQKKLSYYKKKIFMGMTIYFSTLVIESLGPDDERTQSLIRISFWAKLVFYICWELIIPILMFHFYNLNIRFCRIKKYIFTQRKILFNVLLNETNGMFKKYCCTTTQQFVNEHFKNKDCPCNIEEYYNTPTIDDLLNEKLDFKIYEPEIQYFKLRKARICRKIANYAVLKERAIHHTQMLSPNKFESRAIFFYLLQFCFICWLLPLNHHIGKSIFIGSLIISWLTYLFYFKYARRPKLTGSISLDLWWKSFDRVSYVGVGLMALRYYYKINNSGNAQQENPVPGVAKANSYISDFYMVVLIEHIIIIWKIFIKYTYPQTPKWVTDGIKLENYIRKNIRDTAWSKLSKLEDEGTVDLREKEEKELQNAFN